jgi:hypothetical protein
MVDSSEILNSSQTLVVSVSIDSVESYSSVISNSSEILDSSKSSKVLDAAVSEYSLLVQVSYPSVSVDSVEVLDSSEPLVISVPVDSV